MASMQAIRDRLRILMNAIGYNCRIEKFVNFSFTDNGNTTLTGHFQIYSANAKRLEVKVVASKEGILRGTERMEKDSYNDDVRVVSKRFKKSADSAPDIIKWLAHASRHHDHLAERVNTNKELPAPFPFADGEVTDDSYWLYMGCTNGIHVNGVVAIEGHEITDEVRTPDKKTYFYLNLGLRGLSGSHSIITDGQGWYYVTAIGGDRKIVSFAADEKIKKLKTMNQSDRKLIEAAVRQFINQQEPSE